MRTLTSFLFAFYSEITYMLNIMPLERKSLLFTDLGIHEP